MLLFSDAMQALEYSVHCLAIVITKVFICSECGQPIGMPRDFAYVWAQLEN